MCYHCEQWYTTSKGKWYILKNKTIMLGFISPILYLLFIICFLHLWIYLHRKKNQQLSRGTILHIRFEHWTEEQFWGKPIVQSDIDF